MTQVGLPPNTPPEKVKAKFKSRHISTPHILKRGNGMTTSRLIPIIR